MIVKRINKIQYQKYQNVTCLSVRKIARNLSSINILSQPFLSSLSVITNQYQHLFHQQIHQQSYSYHYQSLSQTIKFSMGNQQSLSHKNTIYEDQGKYIIPTKIKLSQPNEQTQVIKNIFGVSDPTLLTRSYWAKNPNNKSSNVERQMSRSPSKSRRLMDSSVGLNAHLNGVEWAQQSIVRPERQILGKSIVSNFRQDLKETPSRNLSKITSCSIISKLNQFQPDLHSTSPIKTNQKPSISNLFHNKNKQNINHEISGSPNPSSKRVRKTQGLQNSALQKSRLDFHRQSQVKDHSQIQNQVSRIFGISNVSSGQSQSRSYQNSKPLRKNENQFIHRNQNCIKPQQIHQQIQSNPHNNSVAINHEICQQTFSRFEQNPALLCSSLQDKFSQKSSKFDVLSNKTHSKLSEIQKFDGLNQDSKNESLMKVLKKITEISIDNPIASNKSSTTNRNHPIRQNTSQILTQNIHKQQSVASKKSQKSQKIKSQATQKQQQTQFELFLHEVKNTASQKSSNGQKSISNKFSSNLSSQNHKNLNYSEAAKANSKSLSKLPIHHLTEIHERNGYLYEKDDGNKFGFLDNEESQQTEEKISSNNDDYFKCSKLKSPKSITSQQVGLNRQRSCAGRIVQTSKAAINKEHTSPFKSKKYDFSKKQSSRNDRSSSKQNFTKQQESVRQGSPGSTYYPQTYKKSPSHKSPCHKSPSHKSPCHKSPSHKSPCHKSPSQKSSSKTLDYQLMTKISTLEGELNTLRLKQELQKFNSRRYSPVKQERSKRKASMNEQQASKCENQQNDKKYCINDFSRCTPFKHRSQYFKLKLK